MSASTAAVTAATPNAPGVVFQTLTQYDEFVQSQRVGIVKMGNTQLRAHAGQRPPDIDSAELLSKRVLEVDLRHEYPLSVILENEDEDLQVIVDLCAHSTSPPSAPPHIRASVFSGQHRLLCMDFLPANMQNWPVIVYKAGKHSPHCCVTARSGSHSQT